MDTLLSLLKLTYHEFLPVCPRSLFRVSFLNFVRLGARWTARRIWRLSCQYTNITQRSFHRHNHTCSTELYSAKRVRIYLCRSVRTTMNSRNGQVRPFRSPLTAPPARSCGKNTEPVHSSHCDHHHLRRSHCPYRPFRRKWTWT